MAKRGSGKYRHYVYIVRAGAASKAAIGTPATGTPTATGLPASIDPVTGAEGMVNDREANELTALIRFRYEAGLVTEKDTIEDRSASPTLTYDVEEVINTRQGDREFICKCKHRS